ncbi:guanine nucleotide-binding protein subunit alpha, partial [Quaeritorhiza haematococci]
RLAKKISDQIDEQIRKDWATQLSIRGPKILLLGSSDSGKTTVLKQMKILHGNGFSTDDRKDFKHKIMDNIVDSIRALVEALDTLQVPLGDPQNDFYARQVREAFPRGLDGSLPSHIVTAIKVLWRDSGIRKYILRTRYRTTQITETRFNLDNLVYRIYDVGGQRSDRLFWAPYFEGEVHAILFIVSLAAYDQLLVEDTTVNRMLDALVLFESICNNPLLKNVNIILFLNKTDLFEKKLRTSSLQKYFPDYSLEQYSEQNETTSELKAAGRYFKRKFYSQNANQEKKIYTHFTTSTDTAHMKVIISAVRDIVTRLAFQASGIY